MNYGIALVALSAMLGIGAVGTAPNAPTCPPWSEMIDPAVGMSTKLSGSLISIELRLVSVVGEEQLRRRLHLVFMTDQPAGVQLSQLRQLVELQCDTGAKLEAIAEVNAEGFIDVAVEDLPSDVRWVSLNAKVDCVAQAALPKHQTFSFVSEEWSPFFQHPPEGLEPVCRLVTKEGSSSIEIKPLSAFRLLSDPYVRPRGMEHLRPTSTSSFVEDKLGGGYAIITFDRDLGARATLFYTPRRTKSHCDVDLRTERAVIPIDKAR